MGGGGVRSKETGQPAGRTRGTKGDATMRGAGRWEAAARGEATRQPAGRVSGVVSRHGRRLLDGLGGNGRRNGSSTVRDGAPAPRLQWTGRRILGGEGQRATAP